MTSVGVFLLSTDKFLGGVKVLLVNTHNQIYGSALLSFRRKSCPTIVFEGKVWLYGKGSVNLSSSVVFRLTEPE